MVAKPKSFSRSESAFIHALYKRLEHKPFDAIHVVDLLRDSGYSRSAFYNKFENKYDFADKMMNRAVSYNLWYMETYSRNRGRGASAAEVYNCSLELYRFIKHNHELYDMILDERSEIFNTQEFIRRSKALVEEGNNFLRVPPGGDPELLQYISFNASISLIRYWKECNYRQSPEFMAEQSRLFAPEAFLKYPKPETPEK